MMTFPDELIIEGVARAVAAFLLLPETGQRIVDRVAELQSELLTPAEAAKLLGVSEITLRRNHVEWGFDKSVALGPQNPRFLRSQIMEAVKSKVIAGNNPEKKEGAGKVTKFPTQKAS
jgi:predicted DNA-binding transcriptional regulator AlpA